MHLFTPHFNTEDFLNKNMLSDEFLNVIVTDKIKKEIKQAHFYSVTKFSFRAHILSHSSFPFLPTRQAEKNKFLFIKMSQQQKQKIKIRETHGRLCKQDDSHIFQILKWQTD